MAHFLLYNLGQDNHNNNSNPMTDHRFSSTNKPFLDSPASMSRQGEPLETSHRDSQDHKQWTMSVPHPKIIPSEPLFPGESPPLLDSQSLEVKPTINYDRKQVLVHDESSTTVSPVPANKSHTFQFIPYHAGSESNHMVSQNKGIMKKKKKRKTKKNKIIIPMKDMIRIFPLPQSTAAKKLRVSISTLKRRFYELGMHRWPSNYMIHEFRLSRINPAALNSYFYRHGTGSDLIHSGSAVRSNSTYYLLNKEPHVKEKGNIGALLNLFDTEDERYIDPMTSAILSQAFAENTPAAVDNNK